MMFPLTTQTFHTTAGARKEVFYPQIIAPTTTFEHDINRTIHLETERLVREQTGDAPSTVAEMLGTYELKNNQRDVFSLTLSNYVYYTGAAHGLTVLAGLTFDLKKERLCSLRDLFKKGSPYVKVLSEQVSKQIRQRNMDIINEFHGISPNQSFYIADKTLVLFFQLYDLTPYVAGFPMFPISIYDIEPIIDEEGPLGRMFGN